MAHVRAGGDVTRLDFGAIRRDLSPLFWPYSLINLPSSRLRFIAVFGGKHGANRRRRLLQIPLTLHSYHVF